MTFFTKYPLQKYIDTLVCFIGDLFGGWVDMLRKFEDFIYVFNSFARKYGIIFIKEQIRGTVHFLDALFSNATDVIITDLYTEPTDAPSLPPWEEFPPKHAFSGIPFSRCT